MIDTPDPDGDLHGKTSCFWPSLLGRRTGPRTGEAGATVQVDDRGSRAAITAVTMQALTGRAVFTSTWDARAVDGSANNMAHINLTRQADAVLVAPASADFMAKLLHGRADDLLSLLCLARPIESCPLLIAPAMNREMWSHPATQRNVVQLRADGAHVLGPASGEQACGRSVTGACSSPRNCSRN
jgi:phosphopantothenoylcysteine decarboxylase/phosphopantothenate--cysteine ligase